MMRVKKMVLIGVWLIVVSCLFAFAWDRSADLKQYGVKHFDQSTKFETSQCLFEDRAGNVHVDLLVSNGGGDLQYARIPLNINTKVIRANEAQKVALVQ